MPLRRLTRTRRDVHVPAIRTRVAASATKFTLKNKKVVQKQALKGQAWQVEAWGYFDSIPELKYSVSFMGNVMAKVRLFVGVRDPDNPEADPVPVTDPNANVSTALGARAQAELRRLKGPQGGLSEICRVLNMNLEIAGECYLVGFGPRESSDETETDGTPVLVAEEWDIRSISEVEVKEGVTYVKAGPNDANPRVLDPDNDTCIRIFQRHAQWATQADCNMRGVLDECEALVLLIGQVKAEAKSQLSGGYMTMPTEILDSAEPEPSEDANDGEAGVNPVLQTLYEGATDGIEDPSSAAAVAPTFLIGPSEFLDPKYVRHIPIGREASAVLEARIQARVERLARGLNLPVEVVLGHMSTTFSNAAQIAADQFADHFYPRDVLVCDALTVAFLQPNLIDAGANPDEVENICVWFEPGDQIKQTDLSVTANEGHTLGAISDAAWRRVNGWSDDDAPDATERLLRMLERVRTVDPGITTGIVELLGEPIDIPATVPAGKTTKAGPDPTQAEEAVEQIALERVLVQAVLARRAGQTVDLATLFTRAGLLAPDQPASAPGELPTPDTQLALTAARAGTRNPGYELMTLERELRARVISAADKAMGRALEKAGNKLRTKSQKHRELVSGTHPRYVAATLGPALVAAAGFTDEQLVGPDSWDGLRGNYLAWGADAQHRALRIAERLVPLSTDHRATVVQRMDGDLAESWAWLADQLTQLAHLKLYSPDPAEVPQGESDPTVLIPAGLVRQAIARAGGATGITAGRTLRAAAKKPAGTQPVERSGDLDIDPQASPYVAVSNGAPLGGIGTGETIMSVLANGDVRVEAYQWEYGPAFRQTPFEEHEALDQEVFTEFDSDVLSAGDWIGDYYFPGDHAGCSCDLTPIIVEAGAVSDSLDIAGGTE